MREEEAKVVERAIKIAPKTRWRRWRHLGSGTMAASHNHTHTHSQHTQHYTQHTTIIC